MLIFQCRVSFDHVDMVVLLSFLVGIVQTLNFGVFTLDELLPVVILEFHLDLWPTVAVRVVKQFTEVRCVAEQLLRHAANIDACAA